MICEWVSGMLIKRVQKLNDSSQDIIYISDIHLGLKQLILVVEAPSRLSTSSIIDLIKKYQSSTESPVKILASLDAHNAQDYNEKYLEFLGIFDANIEPKYREKHYVRSNAVLNSKRRLVEIDRKEGLELDYVLVSSWVLRYKHYLASRGSWFKPYLAVISVNHGKPAKHSTIINLESFHFYNSKTRDMMMQSARADLLSISQTAIAPVPVPALAPALVSVDEESNPKVNRDQSTPIWA